MHQVQSVPWHEVIGINGQFGLPTQVLDACRSTSLRIGGPRLTTVGVTSAIRGEGRSMVAQALALIQANDYRRRVVLLELDLENPALAEQLRLAARPGLAELAQGSSAMSEVLQPFGPRLAAITAGASLPAAGAGILEQLRGGVLRAVQQEADVVVMDLPPLITSPYGRQAAQMAEQLVMVIRAGITPLPRVKEAIDSVSPAPAILLNGVHSSLPRWMQTLLSV